MSRTEFSLSGKRALITGAAGLIGAEVSDAFAEYGADLCLTDLSPTLDNMVESLRELHPNRTISGWPCDITSDTSVHGLFSHFREVFGRLDVFVHLAAIDAKFEAATQVDTSRFDMYPLDLWQRSI